MIVCYIIMVILHVIVHRGCNFGSKCFLIDGSKVLILVCISIVVVLTSQLITNFHQYSWKFSLPFAGVLSMCKSSITCVEKSLSCRAILLK